MFTETSASLDKIYNGRCADDDSGISNMAMVGYKQKLVTKGGDAISSSSEHMGD